MTEDQVMLGAAMMLVKRYGFDAQTRVAQGIGELAAAGDFMGVATWQAIATRVEGILRASQTLARLIERMLRSEAEPEIGQPQEEARENVRRHRERGQ